MVVRFLCKSCASNRRPWLWPCLLHFAHFCHKFTFLAVVPSWDDRIKDQVYILKVTPAFDFERICVLQDQYDGTAWQDRVSQHNTRPARPRPIFLVSDRSCPKTDGLRPHHYRMWDGRAHMPRDWLLITAVTQVIKDQIAVTRRSNRTASLTAWQQHQQQRHWQRYHSALNLLVQPLDALSLGFCLSGTHRGCVGLKIAK